MASATHAVSVYCAEVWCAGVAERIGTPDVLITLDWSMAALAARVAPVLRRVHHLLIAELHDLGDILGIVPACLIDDVVHRQFEGHVLWSVGASRDRPRALCAHARPVP